MNFSRVHVNVFPTGGDPFAGMLGCSVFTRVADVDADQASSVEWPFCVVWTPYRSALLLSS